MINSVLLVDDEPQVVNGLKIALGREPFEILTATSAEEALSIMASQHVDVVISDHKMPGMSGSNFLATVHKWYPDIIRIMLSGQFQLERTVQAINECENFRMLKKPCSSELLSSVIQAALQRRELQRESYALLDSAHQLLTELELEYYRTSIENQPAPEHAPLTAVETDVEYLIEKVRVTLELLENHNIEQHELLLSPEN